MENKKWYKFEIVYKKQNTLNFENKKKLFINYQSTYMENYIKAEEQAINLFEIERFGDKLISIQLCN